MSIHMAKLIDVSDGRIPLNRPFRIVAEGNISPCAIDLAQKCSDKFLNKQYDSLDHLASDIAKNSKENLILIGSPTYGYMLAYIRTPKDEERDLYKNLGLKLEFYD